jgi:parallel beta-helix repeat protein
MARLNEDAGIVIIHSANSTLTDNIASENLKWGIRGGESDNCTLTGNAANSNSNQGGIYFAYSIACTLTNNSVSNNDTGLALWGLSDCTLTGNTSSSNYKGLGLLFFSSNNWIYNNNFINNTIQVHNYYSGENIFNLDRPIGGNYWSNWAGPDADGDGFVDGAHVFDGGQDNLPWVEQDGWAIPPDSDGDGVPDDEDAFPGDPGEWSDNDSDGTGDNADPDDDNDGVLDGDDAFPTNPGESSDNDGDGIGDNGDPDDDNDGVGDNSDAFPTDPSEWSDNDNDGEGDNADPDDDNDGVLDGDDAFPTENKLPICNAGGPYTAACQGFTTVIELDGIGSLDPDDPVDGTLTYEWTTDCVAAIILNPQDPQTLVIVDTSYGVPIDFDVTLTIKDAADSTSTCSASVTIEACSAADLVTDLTATVEDFNLEQGLDSSLDSKLDAALEAAEDINENNDVAAIRALYGFINSVEAQRDKKLTSEQADELIAGALATIELLLGE